MERIVPGTNQDVISEAIEGVRQTIQCRDMWVTKEPGLKDKDNIRLKG